MGTADRSMKNSPQCRMTITKSFLMSRTLITQKQWVQVMGTRPWKEVDASNRPGFVENPDCPAVCVSRSDALEFSRVLSKKSGHVFDLPSEVQWEFGIRGGTTTEYFWGDSAEQGRDFAWCRFRDSKSSDLLLRPVAQLKPNGFGLYDMAGSVREWVRDLCDLEGLHIRPQHYPPSAKDFISLAGEYGIVRNTSYFMYASNAASAFKLLAPVETRSFEYGFRLIRCTKE